MMTPIVFRVWTYFRIFGVCVCVKRTVQLLSKQLYPLLNIRGDGWVWDGLVHVRVIYIQ